MTKSIIERRNVVILATSLFVAIVAYTFAVTNGGIAAVPSVHAAAVDYFLKIKGIPGESTDAGHRGEIDVLAWSWGMSQTGSSHTGAGAGTGKVSVHDISITKRIDVASTKLMLACASGERIPNIELTARKAGEVERDYLRYSFFDVFCTSATWSAGGSGDAMPTENVTLNFTKMKMDYVKQNADGTPGETVGAGWDFQQGKQL